MKELLKTEVAIMQQFDHPGIMKLYEYMESSKNVYLIMDHCNNGDMVNYMKQRGITHFSEFEALQYLKQVAVIFSQ